MGGCQNYGPLLGTLNIRCRIPSKDPKRDPMTTTHLRGFGVSEYGVMESWGHFFLSSANKCRGKNFEFWAQCSRFRV